MTISEEFAAAHPKPVDFAEKEYSADKEAYDAAALANGYRLAGFRLQRAVFSTKNVDQSTD